MKSSGNTILVTGGGSGIGRALAEAFHKAGNTVIVAGRRRAVLDEVTAANPGMASASFDVGDPESIKAFAAKLATDHPDLNVVVNNAGIMKPEDLKTRPGDLDTAETTIATNLLGPIRLTAALLPTLLAKPRATVVMVSSGLAFVPLAMTPTYSATKAAIHSYAVSLRHQLRGTSTQVIEIIPPYVQTELLGPHQASDPNAMPLDAFMAETMAILTGDPDAEEAVVERCKPLRFAAENKAMDATFKMVNGRHET